MRRKTIEATTSPERQHCLGLVVAFLLQCAVLRRRAFTGRFLIESTLGWTLALSKAIYPTIRYAYWVVEGQGHLRSCTCSVGVRFTV
jgi:hypothetical protein